MGRYLRKCKKVVGEIAVVGVKTRAARAALAMAAAASSTSSPAKKIKKVTKSSSSSTAYTTSVPQLRNRRKNTSAPAVVIEEEEEVANCSSNEVVTNMRSDFPASCSSSNHDHSSSVVPEIVKDDCLATSIADPEVEESGEESSKELEKDRTEAREASTKSDEQGCSHSQASKPTVEMKMPSDSEIEEFFSVAEKDLLKRFCDKYNYDIVKDVPLKGRYDWVEIMP